MSVVLSCFVGALSPLAGSSEPIAADVATPPEFAARLERFVDASTFDDVSVEPIAEAAEAATSAEAALTTLADSAIAELSLAASIEPDPFAPQRGQQRSGPHSWNPQYWITVGAHYVDGSYDKPNGFDYTESTAFSVDAGVYNWRGEMGVGLEAGLMINDYELDGDAFGSGAETIDVWRAMVGVRVADRGPNDESYVPYARAGFLYRRDDGGGIRDDGVGWYAGLGLDWRIGDGIAIGPQVLYTSNDSRSSTEWIGGLLLTIGF